MAPSFGVSFDNVTVHTGEEGDARANAHGSPAVTEGSDIFLSSAIEPASPEGRQVIAHEMAHVIQQSDAGPGTAAAGPRGDSFEQEAEQVGDIVASGGSAAPQQRTPEMRAQGYGGWEHQAMADDVHATLDQVVAESEQEQVSCAPGEDPWMEASEAPMFGGFSDAERDEQFTHQWNGMGASHSPDMGYVDDVKSSAVAVPNLAAMLAADPFVDRDRSLAVSLRNFKMQTDKAGPYLGIETDPSTGEAIRYDVPVSPGDLTSLNGDLYGSMENLRKAPVSEFVEVQRIVDAETAWEKKVAAGTADANEAHDFDVQWEKATAWRSQPVYGAGRELGPEGAATGGDTKGYIGLAMENRAHFGADTQQKQALEVEVQTSDLPALAAGPQGNAAASNEQAWMGGHAKALVLAREAHAIRTAGGGQLRPLRAPYGHETEVPETGLEAGAGGSTKVAPPPRDANGNELKRSSGLVSFDSKLNDAYVENAGADHYLTDAFAAGHQIVREVIGQVIEQFVQDAGGQEEFLDYIVARLTEGALADPEQAEGDLGTFQTYVAAGSIMPGLALLAQGQSPVSGLPGFGGMKQNLKAQIDDTKLRGIGAKVVHDYYNQRGLIVRNRKGMTFVTKGDTTAGQSGEAQRIIALAILESRTQIRECAETNSVPNAQDVWDYTPDFDKTLFTETSGKKAMQIMFADGLYMWNLIKEVFKLKKVEDANKAAAESSAEKSRDNSVEDGIQGPPHQGRGAHAPADVGVGPLRDWLKRRREYIAKHGAPADDAPGAGSGAGAGSGSHASQRRPRGGSGSGAGSGGGTGRGSGG